MIKPPSYVAYIDESGCEGFNFTAGSTEWFTLSALIARKHNEQHVIRISERMRELAGRRKRAKFKSMRPWKREEITTAMSKAPFRTITVFLKKPILTAPETFQQPHRLYFYLCRFLIERMSWLCRDAPPQGDGDGTVQMIFHKREGLPYASLIDYIRTLQTQETSIAWPVIDIARIEAQYDYDRIGLRLADAAVNSFFRAVAENDCDDALRLRPVTYCRATKTTRTYLGYGLKFFPGELLPTDLLLWKKWD
jgi:hypothetical protein